MDVGIVDDAGLSVQRQEKQDRWMEGGGREKGGGKRNGARLEASEWMAGGDSSAIRAGRRQGSGAKRRSLLAVCGERPGGRQRGSRAAAALMQLGERERGRSRCSTCRDRHTGSQPGRMRGKSPDACCPLLPLLLLRRRRRSRNRVATTYSSIRLKRATADFYETNAKE